MDNFIDKLAQKFIAGEVIKANSVAEERELKRLREQVAEYERCLHEMQKMQVTNTQTARQLHDLMTEGNEGIKKLTEESLQKLQELQVTAGKMEPEEKETITQTAKAVEELSELVKQLTEKTEANQKNVEKWFHQADEFLHKENVKVYRNVQAVVVEEVGKKAEAVIKSQEENGKQIIKPAVIFSVLAFLCAAGNIILTLMIKYKVF
ncbi:MAG: hypothetical protein IKW28_01070 [Lachnospiraceae bacterium]|nr:hypothetical protein [Lachnospiraceae bacterium]